MLMPYVWTKNHNVIPVNQSNPTQGFCLQIISSIIQPVPILGDVLNRILVINWYILNWVSDRVDYVRTFTAEPQVLSPAAINTYFFYRLWDKSKRLGKLWFKIHCSLVVRDVSWERQSQFSGLTQAEEGTEINLQPSKGQIQLPIDRKAVMFPPGAFCEAPT